MDLRLEGRSIVVTGGSSGIGLAAVKLLLAEGASVATCSRDVQRLADAYRGLGGDQAKRLLLTRCDVRNREETQHLIDADASRFGGVDGLVNNAGQGRKGTFAETTDEEWQDELYLKVFSVLNPLHAALPYLKASLGGRVVNICAISAQYPHPEMVATSAARACVLNLSRSLATELAPLGIYVNTISLGVINTGRLRSRYQQSNEGQPWNEWVTEEVGKRRIPLGRVGEPEEVAPTIALLLSPRSSFTTGANVEVAGGARA